MDLVNQFAEFATKNPLGVSILAFSGVIGTILGVVGIWLSFVAWKDDQKSKKEFDYLLKLAELNIDKNVTEETIEQKQQQLDEISNKVTSLQAQIKRDIPIEARRAVLQDRLNSSIEILTKYYQDIKLTQQELEKLGKPQQIPEEITREIEAEIQPSYLVKEKISHTKTVLSTMTGLAAITSAVLPDPFDDWVRNLFLLAAIPAALRLLKLTMLTKSNSDPLAKQLLILGLFLINLFTVVILSLLCLSLFFSTSFLPKTRIIILISSLVGILIINFLSGFVYKRYIEGLYVGSDSTNSVVKWIEGFFNRSLYSLSKRIVKRKNTAFKGRKRR